MNKNIIIILLIIVSILSVGYGFYQQNQLAETKKQLIVAREQEKKANMQCEMALKEKLMAEAAANQAKIAEKMALSERERAILELQKIKR